MSERCEVKCKKKHIGFTSVAEFSVSCQCKEAELCNAKDSHKQK